MLNLQQQYVKNSPCVVLCLFARSFFFSFSFFAIKVKTISPPPEVYHAKRME